MTIPTRFAQFDFALDRLVRRLDGLTDDEYFWEPVSGCWSVRPRKRSKAGMLMGSGDWVIEFDRPEPDPPPFTTIAWRMAHLGLWMTIRADYTVGTNAMTWDDYEIPGKAGGGFGALTAAGAAWRSAIAGSTDADLDQVGRSQNPWGLDRRLPFLDIVWWVNQEVLHHGGEIALLRDLYRAQPCYRSSFGC